VPGTGDLPSLADLQANAAAIASGLSTASLNKAGGDPRLNPPSNVRALPVTSAATAPLAVTKPSYY
jgi:hypothetical protein